MVKSLGLQVIAKRSKVYGTFPSTPSKYIYPLSRESFETSSYGGELMETYCAIRSPIFNNTSQENQTPATDKLSSHPAAPDDEIVPYTEAIDYVIDEAPEAI